MEKYFKSPAITFVTSDATSKEKVEFIEFLAQRGWIHRGNFRGGKKELLVQFNKIYGVLTKAQGVDFYRLSFLRNVLFPERVSREAVTPEWM